VRLINIIVNTIIGRIGIQHQHNVEVYFRIWKDYKNRCIMDVYSFRV